MSRRNNKKRKFPNEDPLYNSFLVNLMISKILKNGKKTIAQKIIYEAFDIIEQKTEMQPLKIFEKAIKNVSPTVKIKAKRVGGSTYQVPIEVKKFRGINLGLCWIVQFAKARSGKTIAIKLANEIIDASKGYGNAIRKRHDTHRMARSNKAFAHFRS
uniref:Ribosomal protein S7 n=2 Tax=Fucus TaxID=3011 RepID=A0A2R4QQ04_9PHAE|nr:30S ribosomal protein S7 [Fucus vesiculosus]AVZ00649.1 30S ribosomal protein S7 [Fucus spiralis]CAX12515.1 30S ribosomal protein S7 [Fucus vesiculosus]